MDSWTAHLEVNRPDRQQGRITSLSNISVFRVIENHPKPGISLKGTHS